MNSSTVFKKTLPLIVILLVIIGVAVTCTALNKEKENPFITNGDDAYLSTTEGNFEYDITKADMFKELKANVGLSTLINTVNKQILKNLGYFDKVTEEAIAEEIEKATFEDGKEGLTAEEIAEKEEEFEETMFSSYGLKTLDEIKDHYRLTLAKKAYASDKLEEEIKAKDEEADEDSEKYFKESDYTTYYNANYQQEFWAIIVPFSTEAQAKNALAQLGIQLHRKDSKVEGDFDRWVKVVNEEEVTLTPQEVVKAMIDMYNTNYAYKLENYPTEKITLNEGKQYSFDEFGNYVFNTTVSEEDESLNVLHFTYDELANYQTSILNSMRNTWVAYNANSEVSANAKWYTPIPLSYNSGSMYCFALKVAEQQPKELADVKEEITTALKEAKLTTKYIETKMAELRKEKNFTIYDTVLEANYISSMASYSVDHKATKKEQKSIVASIDGVEYTADDLFDLMDKQYGVSTALSLLNYKRFMLNGDYNKYYDYTAEGKEKDKWLDTEKYKELKEEVANEKLTFTSGAYASYGYSPATMTWLDFIKAIYGADNENELLVQFLYNDIVGEFQKEQKDLTEATEESDLWKFYLEKMEGIKNDYFKVKGVHLLICVYDDPSGITNSKATPINPEEWTEEQVKLAKELHDQVLTYIENTTGTIETKLKAISTAFTTSLRYLPTLEGKVEAQPVVEGASYTLENIEVAKFLSAGLNVKYEDLGEFVNGKMVKEFDAAVKSIYDQNPDSEDMVIYRDYLQTEFGFHVYANLKTTPVAEWTNEEDGDAEEKGILPTLELIKQYEEDKDELTTSQKTAVETYYSPIATELGGNYNTYIKQYEAIKGFEINFANPNYDKAAWDKTIEIALESWLEKIVYNK